MNDVSGGMVTMGIFGVIFGLIVVGITGNYSLTSVGVSLAIAGALFMTAGVFIKIIECSAERKL